MRRALLEKLIEFCEYLTDWKNQQGYYIRELLPNLKDGYSYSALPQKAIKIWEEIRKEANINCKEWENIIKYIIYIREHYDEIAIKQKNIQHLKKMEKFYEGNKKIIDELQEKFDFKGFFHTTSFNNFVNIMSYKKLCSRNFLTKNNIGFIDIANKEVVSGQKDLYDYVRFYFRPKTPTNYKNEGIKCYKSLKQKSYYKDVLGNTKEEFNNNQQSSIPVIMIFSPEIINNINCKYRQANNRGFALLNKIQDLKDWNKIFSNGVYSPLSDYEYEKQCRMAELLYPNCISINNIIQIIFRSQSDMERAIKILGEDSRFITDNEYFFNNYLYVTDYKLVKDKTVKLYIKYNIGKCLEKDNVAINDYNHSLKIYKSNNLRVEYNKISLKRENVSCFIIPNDLKWDCIEYSIEDNTCFEVYND